MAGEIVWGTIKTDAQRLLIISEILAVLADPLALPNHEAIVVGPDVNGTNSDTVYIDQDDLETPRPMTSVAEGGTWSNTALATDRFSAAVGQKYLQWNVSDLAAAVSAGKLDAARFARALLRNYWMTWTDVIVTAGTTFSNSVDAGAGAPTMEDAFDAGYALEEQYVTPSQLKMGIIHPSVANALQKDATFAQTANGTIGDPAVIALRQSLGDVYLGRWRNTDWFKSWKVATSGGKYQNIIFSRGGIIVAKGTPKVQTADQVLLEMLMLEMQRSLTKPETFIRGSTFLGADVADDDRGIIWTTAV
jgi:hypothetical protein